MAMVIGVSVGASAMQPSIGHEHASPTSGANASPLVLKVREATGRYKDINIALGEGWVQATPCVSGPNDGAMGVHFLKPERLRRRAQGRGAGDADLRARSGWDVPSRRRRVHRACERVGGAHGPGVAPSIDGHPVNLITEPNRHALPALYEMHVWAWEDNPTEASRTGTPVLVRRQLPRGDCRLAAAAN
jgi:hypothetical protein